MLNLPEQATPILPRKACPIITCPSCGTSDIKGRFDEGLNEWTIECSRCGIEISVPANGLTDLEGMCAVVNECEKLKYEVNKTKEEIRRWT